MYVYAINTYDRGDRYAETEVYANPTIARHSFLDLCMDMNEDSDLSAEEIFSLQKSFDYGFAEYQNENSVTSYTIVTVEKIELQ